MATFIYAFLSVLAVSLVSVIGVLFLTLKEEWVRKYVFLLVSLAVGALLGDAFIHLIPESFERSFSSTGLFIIVGILIFFILEKFMHWHHHGEDEVRIHPVGRLVLFSDGVHNFIDGVIIGVSFMVSVPVGLATTLAVTLHEIPQEIGDFAVLLHAGYTKKRALYLNFLSAASAILGLILAFILGEGGAAFASFVLPFAAGGFIYIALSDLIPEMQKAKEFRHSLWQLSAVLVGILAMLALTLLE